MCIRDSVYDALVAHEVGHALYTPDRDWYKEIQIPPSFVNIVEDVRIEKLMKRRYGGLAKCFYNGYNEVFLCFAIYFLNFCLLLEMIPLHIWGHEILLQHSPRFFHSFY